MAYIELKLVVEKRASNLINGYRKDSLYILISFIN